MTLDLGDFPTDAVVQDAGDEPNGAFWEGVASYVAPALAARLDMDSEGSMFAVYGDRTDLEQLRELLQPLVDQFAAMTGLLQRAQADGVLLEASPRAPDLRAAHHLHHPFARAGQRLPLIPGRAARAGEGGASPPTPSPLL